MLKALVILSNERSRDVGDLLAIARAEAQKKEHTRENVTVRTITFIPECGVYVALYEAPDVQRRPGARDRRKRGLMEEAPKKKRAHFRDNHPVLREYDEWWNSVHVLRCDAEDFAAGRTHLFYTKNSLSQGPLLDKALRTTARGLWLLRKGLVRNKNHWEHLMLRALQSYVTIRDKRWRFTVRDPTKEEVDEIMELAEKNLRASRPDRVNELSNRQCESRRRTKPLVQGAGKEVRSG